MESQIVTKDTRIFELEAQLKEAIKDTVDAIIDEYHHCLREGLGPDAAFQVAVGTVIELKKML
jgi:hypothetical protein